MSHCWMFRFFKINGKRIIFLIFLCWFFLLYPKTGVTLYKECRFSTSSWWYFTVIIYNLRCNTATTTTTVMVNKRVIFLRCTILSSSVSTARECRRLNTRLHPNQIASTNRPTADDLSSQKYPEKTVIYNSTCLFVWQKKLCLRAKCSALRLYQRHVQRLSRKLNIEDSSQTSTNLPVT